ncbi:MAG: hypothetical protein ACR2NX_01885 [Chthoniobacterales bacterium]
MPTTSYQPGSSESEIFTLATPQGRAHLFKKRTEELMRAKADGTSPSLDHALFEMRTGTNPDDRALLEAMGESPSHAHAKKAHEQKFFAKLDQLAEANRDAGKTSSEVAAAMVARNVAFNSRVGSLIEKGLSLDQAIYQMRANSKDAELLRAMGMSVA